MVSAGLFLAVVSTTVVSVALPTIGRELHTGVTGLEWTVDAYVVVYASLLVAGGGLGDRRGRKGLFLAGVAVFGFGSLVCGLAPSVPVLLAGRVAAGLGAALLVPGSLSIIRVVFTDARQRAAAIGLWLTASGLALAVGPPLGGVIVNAAGWRWVFLANAPLALVLVLAAGRILPRLAHTPARTRFDGIARCCPRRRSRYSRWPSSKGRPAAGPQRWSWPRSPSAPERWPGSPPGKAGCGGR